MAAMAKPSLSSICLVHSAFVSVRARMCFPCKYGHVCTWAASVSSLSQMYESVCVRARLSGLMQNGISQSPIGMNGQSHYPTLPGLAAN